MTRFMTIALAALLLAGCSRHAETGGPGTGPSGESTSSQPPGGAPWSGRVLRGEDTEALRHYLRTVQEVKPRKFEVQWNPATVAIDREAAIRSLRKVSRDGATFVFAADEPAVGQLRPGSILWVRDLALRKVDAVTTQGGLTTVHTGVVSLNEAMPNADIEFEAPVPVQNFLLSRPQVVPEPVKTAAHLRRAYGAPVPVLYLQAGAPAPGSAPGLPPPGSVPGLPQPGNMPGSPLPGSAPGTTGDTLPSPGSSPGNTGNSPASGEQPNSDEQEVADDAQEESFQGNAYTGTLKGMQYSLGYAPGADGELKLILESRDAEDGGEGADTSGAEESKDIAEKYKELKKQAKEARDAIIKAQQDDLNEEQEIRNLDADYQKQLAQMKQDDLNRRNPNSTGPSSRPTDSNGTPLTEQEMEARLTRQYEQERSLAVRQLAAKRAILAEWDVKKYALDLQLKALKAARRTVKELFNIASDNLDIRFKVEAQLGGFSTSAMMKFRDGDLEEAKLAFKSLTGHVKAAFVGRLGKPGTKGVKVPVMHIPVVFSVPMPVGGLPFVVQVGADFLVTVSLGGNHATLAVNGEYSFNGTSGFTYAKSSASMSDSSNFSGDKPAITGYQGESLGVSAVVLGVQLPRIGIGLGVTGIASSMAYVDVVHVVTMTQSADVGVSILAPHCKRITYNAAGHVGVQTDVLVIPIEAVQKWASDKASGKREIFNLGKEVVNPPVKACEV